jgi:hypothetical protein
MSNRIVGECRIRLGRRGEGADQRGGSGVRRQGRVTTVAESGAVREVARGGTLSSWLGFGVGGLVRRRL